MVKVGSKKQISPADKRRWQIGSAIVIALLIAFIALLSWIFYVGSSKDIVAVADQFKPDPSWELKSESIVPPQTLCIDVECPSVWRQWKTPNTLSIKELTNVLNTSQLDLAIKGDCNLIDPNRYGNNIDICSASGVYNEYNIDVTVSRSNPSGNSWVGLNISKRK